MSSFPATFGVAGHDHHVESLPFTEVLCLSGESAFCRESPEL
jgi:hypothetical protein